MSLAKSIRRELRCNTTRCGIITILLATTAIATDSQTILTLSTLAAIITTSIAIQELVQTQWFKDWREKQLQKLEEPLEE